MSVSDLSFSGTALATTGSLTDMSVSQINAGGSNDFQWLVANVELSSFDWVPAGTIAKGRQCRCEFRKKRGTNEKAAAIAAAFPLDMLREGLRA